jgi:ABC-2 type transport system permease protein
MWHRIATIIRREYLTTIRRREFWLMTFGLPLLYVVFGLISGLATASAVNSGDKKKETATARVVGFMDQSGLMDPEMLKAGDTDRNITGRLFTNEEDGKKAVLDKTVRSFLVIAKDFGTSGKVTSYQPESNASLFGDSPRSSESYVTLLRRAVLSGKVNQKTIDAAVIPIGTDRLSYDPTTGKFGKPNAFKAIGKFVVPYAFSMLLMFAVFFSSSYLLHGIVEEKENRIIEVLLSSATHEELLAGKLIGLGGVGLTQLLIWAGSAALVAAPAAALLPAFASIHIAPSVIVTAFLMFLFGFGLYAAMMAGMGSLGTTWKESQQTASIVTWPIIMPLLFMPVLLEQPDGALARFFSLFPFTAPIGMMLRISAGGGSALEVAIAIVLLVLATIGVVILAARLLRLSLLLYGQRPSAALIWRGLITR